MLNRNESYLMEEQGTNKQNDTTPGTYKYAHQPPSFVQYRILRFKLLPSVTKGDERCGGRKSLQQKKFNSYDGQAVRPAQNVCEECSIKRLKMFMRACGDCSTPYHIIFPAKY